MNAIAPIDADTIWFPVRVTSVPVAGQYVFAEVWLDTNGVNADRVGGRVNTANDPAYAIDGSTFAVTAAGSAVQCFARRGPGTGGVKWELKGFGGSDPTILQNSGGFVTPVGWNWITGAQWADHATLALTRLYFSTLVFTTNGGATVFEFGIGAWPASYATPELAAVAGELTIFPSQGYSYSYPAGIVTSTVSAIAKVLVSAGLYPLKVAPIWRIVSGGLSGTFGAIHFSYVGD